MNLIAEMISVANHFGADDEYSRAGGGNASVKVGGTLLIKPSGVPLATLKADDLVGLRTDLLLEALHDDESGPGDPVQIAAARALLDAPGGRRPSVELLFHALIPELMVLHTHPLVANALTCNEDAAELVAALFGDEAIFVPYTDPGVPLARRIHRLRADYSVRTGRPAPGITFLGNHGIIVSGNSATELTQRMTWLTGVISAAIEDVAPADAVPELDETELTTLRNVIAPTLRGLIGSPGHLAMVTSDSSELVRAVTMAPAGQTLLTDGPLIPDQIVYSGSLPLVIEPQPGDDLINLVRTELGAYRREHGRDPLVAVVPGLVAFGIGKDLAGARTALATFTDALRVARDANRIGAVRCLDQEERGFIENWEAESYRRAVGAGSRTMRMSGKVAMVTGGAQGFGLGIATRLLAEGAHVVLADLNIDLATKEADRLAVRHGAGRVVAVRVDVSDPDSQQAAVAQVVATFGGLDVFISNAGVLRADGVLTQQVADFDLVTQVNYRGYFLGVRAVAPIMVTQHAARPDAWFDIIEINSKSGLEGSKRNFAYSGSKFGGIGLTKSFALELVEQGIKVNAICPGNFLDGPLWSDPERGLFVQYLRAGKVPGARSVADVRRFYESKVPMGRGCTPEDVAKAVFYVIEQAYETGQAVPVSGGQIMLS